MEMPRETYSPSPRLCRGSPDLTYPLHDKDVMKAFVDYALAHSRKR
jgi:hypothetical protein